MDIKNNEISYTFIYFDEKIPVIVDSTGFDTTKNTPYTNSVIEDRTYDLILNKITKMSKARFTQTL
jgi:hypothetical protein